MKKYLLLGLALIGVNCFPAAHAATVCPAIGLTNGHGSPQVVYGQTLGIIATGISPISWIYLDGVQTGAITTVTDPVGNLFTSGATFINVPYGTHTLRIDWSPCILDFSNVPQPPVPGTPSLSSNRSSITAGGSFTLSWTVPSGSVDHYTLHKSASGGAETDTNYPGNATAVTLTGSAPPGLSKTLTFTLRACSSIDESSCGAWSNAVSIDVDAPCTGRCP